MPLRRNLRIGCAGLADIDGHRVWQRHALAEDGVEVLAPLLREQQRMVRQSRQLPRDPQHDQHGTRSGIGLLPHALRIAAVARRQQLRLRMVQVGRRDDDLNVFEVRLARGIPPVHAPAPPVRHGDAGHLGIEHELDPCLDREAV